MDILETEQNVLVCELFNNYMEEFMLGVIDKIHFFY